MRGAVIYQHELEGPPPHCGRGDERKKRLGVAVHGRLHRNGSGGQIAGEGANKVKVGGNS
jgi:hypothetical protein